MYCNVHTLFSLNLQVVNIAMFVILKKYSQNIGHVKIKIAKFNTFMISVNNEIEAVVSLVSTSCLGVFFFSLLLHQSLYQNCTLLLHSSKSRLCSHQTFHLLVLVIVFNMCLVSCKYLLCSCALLHFNYYFNQTFQPLYKNRKFCA